MSNTSSARRPDATAGLRGPAPFNKEIIMGKQTNSKPPKEAAGKGGKGGY